MFIGVYLLLFPVICILDRITVLGAMLAFVRRLFDRELLFRPITLVIAICVDYLADNMSDMISYA